MFTWVNGLLLSLGLTVLGGAIKMFFLNKQVDAITDKIENFLGVPDDTIEKALGIQLPILVTDLITKPGVVATHVDAIIATKVAVVVPPIVAAIVPSAVAATLPATVTAALPAVVVAALPAAVAASVPPNNELGASVPPNNELGASVPPNNARNPVLSSAPDQYVGNAPGR